MECLGGRFWPIPAARLIVYSEAGNDPKETFGFFAMKFLPLTLICCALSFTSVSSAEGPDDETTAAAFEFAFMVFDDFRITPEIGVVYEPVFSERFGHPERTKKNEEYGDPTYKVIREAIFYDGLEIVISRGVDQPPSGWTWLERVHISGSQYTLRHGLRVGKSLQDFEKVLGPWRLRRSAESSEVSFYAGGYGEPGGVTHGAHATVTLALEKDGSVSSVSIDYWAD